MLETTKPSPSLGGGTRVVAYTYEADFHCIACTRQRFGKHRLAHMPSAPHDYDNNGIDYKQADREGNLVHPVFGSDQSPDSPCGTCHQEL